jgi:putative flavoprotein involved in K+ transport
MKTTTTVIIGAGHSGLAMSRELSRRNIDHIVVERGQVANSWRKERWDSLRLLSPNWMNGLPGHEYEGADQDGYMHVSELIERLDQYALMTGAPVQSETTVLAIGRSSRGYRVQTDNGAIECRSIVMANGAFAIPNVPEFVSRLPANVGSFTSKNYKRPSDLPNGKVLVVGASATGLQLAREIQISGRQVTVAVGGHLRMPRIYRDADIMTWMDIIGVTRIPYSEVDDIERVRRVPSPSLIAGETVDLNTLQDIGVEVVGRLASIQDGQAIFSGSLANACAAADLKMNRLLASIDDWIRNSGLEELIAPAERYTPIRVPEIPRLRMDLANEGYRAILWATGYQPDFSWLNLPVFDRKGRLAHDGGVVSEGLYAMGLPYLRQRKSTFIDGAGEDANALADHLAKALDQKLAA